MKKYYKILFIAFICSDFLMADMVFNLGGQQLFNSVKGNFKDSTYNLKNTVVSTALKFDKGHYIPNGSGNFQVKLKKPKAKWGVAFDIDSNLHYKASGVTLMGKKGNILTIFFSYEKISINGKVIKVEGLRYQQKIVGTIQSNGKIIKVLINGQYSLKIDESNFKLAYISANLGTDNGVPDKLNDLAISTSD